jgi:acyl carrier protein
MMNDVRPQILDIFKQVLKNEKLRLSDTLTHNDVDGWDSLAQVELISQIEQQFEIEFTLKDLPRLNSVGNIIQLVQEKTN